MNDYSEVSAGELPLLLHYDDEVRGSMMISSSSEIRQMAVAEDYPDVILHGMGTAIIHISRDLTRIVSTFDVSA